MKKIKALAVTAFLVVTLVGMAVVAQPVGASMAPAVEIEDDLLAFLERVGAFLAWLWAQFEVKFLVGHISINLIAGLAASIKTGEFKVYKVAEFLYRKLLPYVLLYTVFRVVGDMAGLSAIGKTVFGLIELALWGDLIENLGRLGIKLPDGVARAVSKV